MSKDAVLDIVIADSPEYSSMEAASNLTVERGDKNEFIGVGIPMPASLSATQFWKASISNLTPNADPDTPSASPIVAAKSAELFRTPILPPPRTLSPVMNTGIYSRAWSVLGVVAVVGGEDKPVGCMAAMISGMCNRLESD